MTASDDDLERLREALRRSTPAIDTERRAEVSARALAAFDAFAAGQAAAPETEMTAAPAEKARQGSAGEPRSKTSRPFWSALSEELRAMFERLTSKVVLGATASAMTVAVAMVVVGTSDQIRLPQLGGDATHKVAAPPVAMQKTVERAAPAAASAPEAAVSAQIEPQAEAAMDMALAPMPEPSAGVPATAPVLQHSLRARHADMPAMMQSVTPEPTADRFVAPSQNGVMVTAEAPVSTFSIDVDTASWSWVRSALRHGQMPDPASVRLEEMVNYFPYDYAPPAAGEAPFSVAIDRFAAPWNAGTELVRIGLQGAMPAGDARPPLNLVFLVDTSGSMQGDDRLGLLKTGLSMLLGELRAEDRVAIVAYAGVAGEVLAPTSAQERDKILAALEGLQAEGGTAGGAGLELAYRMAGQMKGDSAAVSRVVLATDGDFNLGPSDDEALKALVSEKRRSGTYLSVLGFGRGNLNDGLMQALAQNGNGQAAYIDSAEEARKVLVDQAAGQLISIADDVKIQVEWNPATVAEYRLLGYETRALAREDFSNDKVDAGEIGAGHQVTALYEITPVGSDARRIEPLRYGTTAPAGASDEAGWLRLRYKPAGEGESRLIEAPIPAAAAEPDGDARFATAIAGFAQLLTGGTYTGAWGYQDAAALAASAKGEDRFGYRAEAIRLIETAASLARQ